MDTQYRFKFISTFAGCGGSSLGYHWAGGKELLAVEWDDNAVETFKLNFPDVPVYHGDIHNLSVEECLRLAGIKAGELDIFDGSPPCQGFSTAGKRDMNDDRNQLFREYVRLLRGLQPKVFVMENVSGMVKGKMKLIFAEIMRELKASGYKVKCQLMNAMYFNVPQSRERTIFIGVREDLGIEPSHPKAQSWPITLGDALQDADVNYIPAPLVTGKAAEIGFALRQGQRGSDITKGWQDTIRPALNAPCPTLLKEAALWKRYPKMIHPTENRGVSIGEVMRIQSFPRGYQFAGEWVEAWARIGNSVPPRFMQAIAEHIRDNILSQCQ